MCIPTGTLGDLWKYDRNWTFVKGPELPNADGVMNGPIREPNPYDYPGSRQYPACWSDNNGHLWLYGGSTTTAFGVLHILLFVINNNRRMQ